MDPTFPLLLLSQSSADLPYSATENASCRASTALSGYKYLPVFCKEYTHLHSPMYTTNLKWLIEEVRAVNQAGAERKRHSKRAKIILWLVKMSWWESSDWLQMSSQKKDWISCNSLSVCLHVHVCVRVHSRKMLLLTWMEDRELSLRGWKI